jgi:predicted dehydrogenase
MSQVTRRHFFEQSLFAAAAAATAAQVNQSFAAEAEPAIDANVPPSETLQHAVIGCRIRGKVHAAEFARVPGVQIAYVCDPDLELANALADAVEKQSGKRPQVVQDLRKIYDDKSIDTVSIAAPNHWHALGAIWAMQAGKHVYVEKPVCHNIVEGRRMVDAARKYKKICQGGTQNRSVGAIRGAAEYVQAGKLGDVKLARTIIYGKRGAIGPAGTCEMPPQLDFNLWLGPAVNEKPSRPKLHYDWHWVWDTGNGELGNNNIHMADICRLILGLEGLGDSVMSIGGRLGYEDAGETPNTQLTVHRFGDKTMIQEVRGLTSKPFSDKFKSGYVIYGSEGLVADGSLFDLDGKLVRKFEGEGQNHFANFIKAVRSGNPADLNAEIAEGHVSTGLCHVANISHRLGAKTSVADIQSRLSEPDMNDEVRATFGRLTEHLGENTVDLAKTPLVLGPTLKIDAKNEKFADNSAADALLGREYRKGFELPTL